MTIDWWWAAHVPVLAILASSRYGVTDQVHQGFVPFRESSGWGVLTDSVGACMSDVCLEGGC